MNAFAWTFVMSLAFSATARSQEATGGDDALLVATRSAERAEQAAKEAEAAAVAAREAATAAAAAANALRAKAGQPALESQPNKKIPGAGVQAASNAGTETPGQDSATARKIDFQLTANQQGGNATIKISQSPDQRQNGLLYAATLSSPVAKNSEITLPATLDGLYNAATLNLDLGRYVLLGREDSGALGMFGGSFKLGHQEFKFFDPDTLKKDHANEAPKSIALFGGRTFLTEQNAMILAKYEYQRGYADADSKILCPESIGPSSPCISGPIGKPKLTTKRLISLDGRYEAKDYELRSIFTYDTVSNAKGVDILYYFINAGETPDKPLPFSAGLDLGWRSDPAGPVIGLFVGTPFSFYGTP